MYILLIEHPVNDYETWKQAFDSDPLNRKRSGMGKYTISRRIDDQNIVIVELEFENIADAETCLTNLQSLWNRVGDFVINSPRTTLSKVEERKELK
jgi:hypothetical protein